MGFSHKLTGRLVSQPNGLNGNLPGKLVFGRQGEPGPPGPKGDTGFSSYAAYLLYTILRAAEYTLDQSQNITALAIELGLSPETEASRTSFLGVAVLGEMYLGG